MAKNEWIDSYFIKGNGRMAARNVIHQSSVFPAYFKEDGTFAKNYYKKSADTGTTSSPMGKLRVKNGLIINTTYSITVKWRLVRTLSTTINTRTDGAKCLEQEAVDIGWPRKRWQRYLHW